MKQEEPSLTPCAAGWRCASVKADSLGPIHCVGIGKTEAQARRQWTFVVNEPPLFLHDAAGPHRRSLIDLYTSPTFGKPN